MARLSQSHSSGWIDRARAIDAQRSEERWCFGPLGLSAVLDAERLEKGEDKMKQGILAFADVPEGENGADGTWYYTPVVEEIKPLPYPPCPPGKAFLSATYTSR